MRKVRRTHEAAVQVVGPAVQRTDDIPGVAAPFEHDRLAMAADIGQQFHTRVVAHQHAGVIHPGQRVEIAEIRRHDFVTDIPRSIVEQQALLEFEELAVEIPGHG